MAMSPSDELDWAEGCADRHTPTCGHRRGTSGFISSTAGLLLRAIDADVTGSSLEWPVVHWLAAKAERCPVPSFWRRFVDDRGKELFIHEYDVYPPQIVHPMLGYFAMLASMIFSASKADEEASIQREIDAFRMRILREAAELAAACSGPVKSDLGEDEWLCDETGWCTGVDPEESPRYLLRVVEELQKQLLSKPNNLETRSVGDTLPSRAATLGTTICLQTVRHAEGATPSTATPPSTEVQRSMGRYLALPSSFSPWKDDACSTDRSCNWYDVASPKGARSPASTCSRSNSSEPDLETAYGLDWVSPSRGQSACDHLSAEHVISTPRIETTTVEYEFSPDSNAPQQSPDLEAAYGWDWNQPQGRLAMASFQRDPPPTEWSTPVTPKSWDLGPAESTNAAVFRVVISSPKNARCSTGIASMSNAGSPDDDVRPQRLDFASAFSPGEQSVEHSPPGQLSRTPTRNTVTFYQDAVRVGVGVRKLLGDAFARRYHSNTQDQSRKPRTELI
eukprot:TRINITY_DN27290_c0_g1_i1.p1 TRINITY_DN27290_c0_g1~~TRINITY_DN27290_c0_g1_i1.p1  ORF type:complete len:520 (+),score=56.50 TRINITY_DN27290_c0_g1_i1:40-1560(+)